MSQTEKNAHTGELQPRSKTATIGLIITLIGSLAFLLSGYGYQWGWWGVGTAIRVFFLTGTVIALIGGIVSIFGIYYTQHKPLYGFNSATAGLFLAVLTIGVFIYFLIRAMSAPAIHDITTDTSNPPQFHVIDSLRADAPNKTEYAGAEVARKQKKAYPYIQPKLLNDQPDQAFKKALDVAQSMSRWEIHNVDSDSLRIEATATIPWFGFKDDIVVRVTPDGMGSRIDVRSVSRVGKSDLGENARRIDNYLAKIKR